MAVVSYLFDRTSDLLKSMVFRGRSFLKSVLSQVERISHVGSTAIKFIWAKPIIDILVEVPKECDLSRYKDLLVNSGYICMTQSADRISFNKGYTEKAKLLYGNRY